MRTNIRRSVAALVVLTTAAIALMLTSGGRASEVGFTFTGGALATGQTGTFGLYFTANDPKISIDALGFFDYGQDGIQDHRVGIWASNGTLVASTTVTTANSTLSGPVFNGGQYRFTPITPLIITFGGGHILGAEIVGAGTADPWYTGVTTVNNAPDLVQLAQTLGRFTPNAFSFPDMNGGPFGAGAFLVSVPEPNCAALCTAFGALLGLLRCSRK